MDGIVLLLEKQSLFENIPSERVGTLLMEDAEIRPFSKGDTLQSPESDMHALTFLIEGTALVYKDAGDGRRLLMSRLVCGDVFGMASLFYEAPYPTQIIAEKDGYSIFWPRDAVTRAMEQEPSLALNYIRLLSERIHFLNHRIDVLAGDDLRSRLLRFLQSLRVDAGCDILLPYTWSQVAALLGVGRASLYRTLDALKAEGMLTHTGRCVHLDMKALTGEMPVP